MRLPSKLTPPHSLQLPISQPLRPPAALLLRRCRCYSASSDAAPAPSAAAAAAASPEPLQQQLEQEQQQSFRAPTPLDTPESPDEQPKKLAANARLSENLASTSITIIGDNTELNWAVCSALSKKIGWFPVSTSKVLLGLHKAESLQEIVEREGQEALAASEAKILQGMKDQLRCCVATVGDGAAADSGLYRNLYGTIIIWLDEEDKRKPKAASPSRSLYQQQAEVRAVLQKSGGGFGDKELSLDDKAQKAAGQLIKAMNQLLKENSYLPAKKRLYVEMGCRGDWPELRPEDWNPVLEGLERKPVVDGQQSE